MGWVAASEYDRSQPDPLADSMDEIIQQMNADHKDELVLIARNFAHIESQEATMTAVDRLGFHVRVKTPGWHALCPRSIRASGKQSGGNSKGLGRDGATGALADRVNLHICHARSPESPNPRFSTDCESVGAGQVPASSSMAARS